MFVNQRNLSFIVATMSLMLVACKGAQSDAAVATATSEGDASMSVSGDVADERGQALVRVVNAVAGSKGLQVRGDTAHMMPTSNYKGVTEYHPIDNTWVKFEVMGQIGGVMMPLEANREVLTNGHRYTMVVMREEGDAGFTTRILRDEISMDHVKSYLRVIHAAPNAGEIDVQVKGGDKIFEGVNFTSEAGYKELDPMSGVLELRSEDGDKLLLSLPKVDLKAGTYYSLVVTKSASGKLEAFWIEDSPTTSM